MLWNDVEREGAKPNLELVSGLFCYVPFHNIRYGIVTMWSEFFFISGTVALRLLGRVFMNCGFAALRAFFYDGRRFCWIAIFHVTPLSLVYKK